MPTEIADSDAESDLNSPAKVEELLPKHPPETQQSAASNDLGVHFSDFLCQEEQLYDEWHVRSPNLQQTTNHVGVESQESSPGIGNERAPSEHLAQHALTDVHAVDVQSELAAFDTTPTTTRKRRHSTTDDCGDAGGSDQVSQNGQRQSRTKTDGKSSGCQRSSHPQASDDAFRNPPQIWQAEGGPGDRAEPVPFASAMADNQDISGIDVSMRQPPTPSTRAIREDERQRKRNRPRRVLSLLEESLSDVPRDISTSRSSMGDYESINIDFRSTASGRDICANPFGSISQTSIEDEGNDIDREKMAVQFSFDDPNTSAPLQASILNRPEISSASEGLDGYSGADGEEQLQMPERSKSIDPMLLHHELPNDAQPFSSSRTSSRKSGKPVSRTSMSPIPVTDGSSIHRSFSDNGLISAKAIAKKRGRKPKSPPFLSESPRQPQEEEDPERNDDVAVGLPREQSKPRPSRSRAVSNLMPPENAMCPPVIEMHETKNNEQSSPIKQPTSELNLGDEAFIGLPKENYKPRPSRSCSKRTTLGEEEITQLETSDAVGDVPTSSAVVPDVADVTPVRKTKKPPKKTKVKRAKTSAAALLKKSQAMLSDGEDDVLWLDTKPSKVKLDLPAAIKREVNLERKEIPAVNSGSLWIEAAIEGEGTDGQLPRLQQQDADKTPVSRRVDAASAAPAVDDINHEATKRTDTTHIVVEIPPPPASLTHIEPKKRGRKKKSSEALPNHVADLEGPGPSSESAAVATVGEPSEKAVAAPPPSPAKKRGCKRKGTEAPAEKADVNKATGHESDASPSEDDLGKCTRSALAEKDVNCPVPHPNVKSTEYTTSDLAHDAISPGKENGDDPAANVETPRKQASKEEDGAKGPTKHSPINPSGGKALYRVGLSKRAAIPPLLKIVRKDIAKSKEQGKPKKRPESHVPVEEDE